MWDVNGRDEWRNRTTPKKVGEKAKKTEVVFEVYKVFIFWFEKFKY